MLCLGEAPFLLCFSGAMSDVRNGPFCKGAIIFYGGCNLATEEKADMVREVTGEEISQQTSTTER